MTSIHRKGVPPGGLRFPWGLLFKICHCGRWVGILIRCPNHWSRFILNWSLTVASPHSSRTSALQHLSHRVRARMSRRHCIWKVVSFRMSLCHWPCFCTVEENRHHHCSKHTYLGSLAQISAPQDLASQHLVHSACLLHSHCQLLLYHS